MNTCINIHIPSVTYYPYQITYNTSNHYTPLTARHHPSKQYQSIISTSNQQPIIHPDFIIYKIL